MVPTCSCQSFYKMWSILLCRSHSLFGLAPKLLGLVQEMIGFRLLVSLLFFTRVLSSVSYSSSLASLPLGTLLHSLLCWVVQVLSLSYTDIDGFTSESGASHINPEGSLVSLYETQRIMIMCQYLTVWERYQTDFIEQGLGFLAKPDITWTRKSSGKWINRWTLC